MKNKYKGTKEKDDRNRNQITTHSPASLVIKNNNSNPVSLGSIQIQ